jgi:choloylglycine hydrolase
MHKWFPILAALFICSSACPQAVIACTDVVLNKTNGLVISGRTLDFDCQVGSNICFKEKGSHITDPCSKFTKLSGAPYSWTAKYSAVLVDALGLPAFADGMNTEGLAVATLWHDDTQPATDVESGTTGLANISLVEYIVENAKDIDEAKRLTSELSLVMSTVQGQAMTLHWIVTDRTGKSIVIELKQGRPKYFEQVGQIGVLTNAPSYDQQLANLKTSESVQNTDPTYNLPGDYKSTSRFVKSAFLVSHVPEFKNAEEGVVAATQILHNVESPKGVQKSGSYTQWMAVRDQTNLRYYLMGVNHPETKLVDLRTVDFKQLASKRVPVDSPGSGDVASMLESKSLQSMSASKSGNQ